VTHSLELRLRGAGIACHLEFRDRLVILVPDPGSQPLSKEDRLRALQLSREEGFSHAAIELNPDVAAFPGD
jgi:hypothetical protein